MLLIRAIQLPRLSGKEKKIKTRKNGSLKTSSLCTRVKWNNNFSLSCSFSLFLLIFFFPKAIYSLISQRNHQVCQLWEQTVIISHHSLSKFPNLSVKRNPPLTLIKFRALQKEGCEACTPCSLPQTRAQLDHDSVCPTKPSDHAPSLHVAQTFTSERLIQMALPRDAQFSFPLLLCITSPSGFQLLSEMHAIQC